MTTRSQYKPEYIDKIDEYLKLREDSVRKILVKTTSRGSKEYAEKLIVKLPTIEGFAEFLGVARKTLYNWADENPEFDAGLEKIKNEQLQRLIDEGLGNNYNSTIAKLMLSHNHGMREGIDATSKGEKINNFTNEQIDRIAERISRGKGNDGDTPSEE